MPLLDRYLGRIILHYTSLSMLVLLGLFAFVQFLDQLGDLGKGEYGLLQAACYTALTLPRTVYELFPMAMLLGTMLGLSLLAHDSELIVMRASGVSIWQITRAALKMGGLFVIVAILIGEWVAPPSDAQAQRGRAEALQQNIHQQTDSGLWLRDARTYFNAGEVRPDLTLLKINIFEFNANRELRALISAARGEFNNRGWTLHKVSTTTLDAHGNSATEQRDTLRWHSDITPQILSVLLLQPDQLSLSQLLRYVRYLDDNQQQTAAYQLALWNKLMLPLSAAVMVVLAIPFAFVNLRSGALGRSLFIGIMLGLSFYALTKGFGYFALAYGLPPLLGATLPPLTFLLGAIVMLRKIV